MPLRDIVGHYPGLQSEVVTFLGDRISESLSGETAQVAVKVFGDDLDALDATGQQIVAVLGKIPGVVDLQFKRQSGTPAIAIQLRPDALAASGLKAADVLDTIETAYTGAQVGQTFTGTRTVDAVVILPDALRHQPGQVAQLMIGGPTGPVPLSQVARVLLTQDRYSIEHDGGQRRISVTFNVNGASLQSVVQHASQAIASQVVLPPGVYTEFSGAAEAESQTRNELLLYSGLALALILMILFVSFKWRANSWLVMANLPFALVGSVAAIALTGIGVSLGTVVGLVTVFGVSARNAILQLAHYEHLVEVEGAPWNTELVIRGANERLVPILMTAVVTALGLAPLAVGHEAPWPGNRGADGSDGAGRIGILYHTQSVCTAGPGATLRQGSRSDSARSLKHTGNLQLNLVDRIAGGNKQRLPVDSAKGHVGGTNLFLWLRAENG